MRRERLGRGAKKLAREGSGGREGALGGGNRERRVCERGESRREGVREGGGAAVGVQAQWAMGWGGGVEL